MSEREKPSREELASLVMVQAQTIAKLQAEVAELRRRLGLNSGNSSMPPSADDLPGRTPPQEKQVPPAKRKRGKQPGAMGMNLKWSDHPDQRLDYYPSGTCGCGADLATANDLGVALSHQEHDIPAVTATVTQHDRHRVRCGCGCGASRAAAGGCDRRAGLLWGQPAGPVRASPRGARGASGTLRPTRRGDHRSSAALGHRQPAWRRPSTLPSDSSRPARSLPSWEPACACS